MALSFPLRAALLGLVLLLALAGSGFCAPSLPAPMDPPRLVNDYAGLFSLDEQRALEKQARDYEAKTSTQICIVTVQDTGGSEALDYATAIGNEWGIGQRGKDNGILLLIVAPGGSYGANGQVAVALGTGVERVVSGSQAQNMVDNTLVPLFKKGLYAEGASQTVHTFGLLLGDAFSGTGTAAGKTRESAPAPSNESPFSFAITIIAVIGGVAALLIVALAVFAKLAGHTVLELLKMSAGAKSRESKDAVEPESEVKRNDQDDPDQS